MRIFFRWFKTKSRVKNSQNEPEVYELQGIKMGKVKDRIAREDLFTEKDIQKLLSACNNSNRNKALIDVHSEAGRSIRKNMEVGICGEHGGDPSSIKFCHGEGLSYVSASPHRIPIAIVAAAQAAIEQPKKAKKKKK